MEVGLIELKNGSQYCQFVETRVLQHKIGIGAYRGLILFEGSFKGLKLIDAPFYASLAFFGGDFKRLGEGMEVHDEKEGRRAVRRVVGPSRLTSREMSKMCFKSAVRSKVVGLNRGSGKAKDVDRTAQNGVPKSLYSVHLTRRHV